MAIKKGLGKGLNALLTSTRGTEARSSVQEPLSSGFLELPILSLNPGRYQPRREMAKTELEALADSIRTQGILQPIVVRSDSKGQYEIIAGERRWRAAQLAGLQVVPVILKQVDDASAMAMALIENIQRADLTPLEEAIAFERLAKEFGLTHVQVAEAVGKSRAAITNSLRLLTLSNEVKQSLERGEIEVGHAKVLLGLRGHEQVQLARVVIEKGLSVRETEQLMTRFSEHAPKISTRKTGIDPNIRQLQKSLSEKLGANLQIQHGQQGKGKLVIQYNSLEELEGILEHIH